MCDCEVKLNVDEKDLLRCRFCKSSDVYMALHMINCNVECKFCGAQGPSYPIYANFSGLMMAKDAWNKGVK